MIDRLWYFLLWPVRFISPFLFSTGAIVGGVVGAVLFFLFVGAVSFICWQNSKKKKNTNIDVEPEIGNLIHLWIYIPFTGHSVEIVN